MINFCRAVKNTILTSYKISYLNLIMKKIYVLFLLFVVSAQSIAQPVGSPPQEAFESCANSSQGSSCSFNAPHGRITGTCRLS